jgi:hypothetical protein
LLPSEKENGIEKMKAELEAGEAAALALLVVLAVHHVVAGVIVSVLQVQPFKSDLTDKVVIL